MPPSVKTIEDYAFVCCTGLMTVELGDGRKDIGEKAFGGCTSIQHIVIPHTVKAIRNKEFGGCTGLITVNLGYGLEEIGMGAFWECRSLQRIVIPPAVKSINQHTFTGCLGLTIVILKDGLNKIGYSAFYGCTSLRHITIPPAVTSIDTNAFNRCSNLTNVRFCNGIEELVSGESMWHWWNYGVHEMSLRTYCFLVQCNIPERVVLLRATMWQVHIHEQLRRIPSISSPKGLNSYFDSIVLKLSVYEHLKDVSALLELAIWKSKIIEQYDLELLNHVMKMQCRTDSITMVNIIVRNVLSFLTDGD